MTAENTRNSYRNQHTVKAYFVAAVAHLLHRHQGTLGDESHGSLFHCALLDEIFFKGLQLSLQTFQSSVEAARVRGGPSSHSTHVPGIGLPRPALHLKLSFTLKQLLFSHVAFCPCSKKIGMKHLHAFVDFKHCGFQKLPPPPLVLWHHTGGIRICQQLSGDCALKRY